MSYSKEREKFKVYLKFGDTKRGVCIPTNIKYSGLVKYVASKFSLDMEAGLKLSYKFSSNNESYEVTDDDEVAFFVDIVRSSPNDIPELSIVQENNFQKVSKNETFNASSSNLNQTVLRCENWMPNFFENSTHVSYENALSFNENPPFFDTSQFINSQLLETESQQTYAFNEENNDILDTGDGDVQERLKREWQKNTFQNMPSQQPTSGPVIKPRKARNFDSSAHVQSEQWFANKQECKLQIGKKAILDGYQFKVRKSDPKRYDVVCINYPECEWLIVSNRIKHGDAFVIGKMNDVHTCDKTLVYPNHRNANKEVLGSIIKDQIQDSKRVYRGKEIQGDINLNYKINISYKQAWRGKARALEMLMGSDEESFFKLPYYCHNLKLKNPGTVTHIKTDECNRFDMLFVAIGVAIRSFVNCVRPLIIVDGAHLKGKFLGTNLLAVSMDGNNQILPIAYGVCKGESSECWTWFLSKLKECIGERENLVIISDRHPSIALAVRELFPNSFHGLCCRHLEMILKLKSKSVRALYWKICKAYTVNEFSTLMSYLSDAQPIAFAKLSEVGYGRWSGAHCPANRYNYCTSNSAESMNALSASARKMPITMLIEFFRAHVQEKYYEHRIAGESLQGELTEWAAAKVEDRVLKSATWKTYGINDTHYEVEDRRHRYIVDLENQMCGCRKWQLSGLPCGHAIAVSKFLKQTSCVAFAKEWFKKPVYQATYRDSIFPVGDTEDWEILEDVEPLYPPLMEKRQTGRPKNKDRIPSQGEVPIKRGCTRCHQPGHKRSQCQAPFPSESKARPNKPPRSTCSQSSTNDSVDLDDI